MLTRSVCVRMERMAGWKIAILGARSRICLVSQTGMFVGGLRVGLGK